MQIMFIYVDITEENLAKPFLTLLGLEDSQKTVVSFFLICSLFTLSEVRFLFPCVLFIYWDDNLV